VRSLGQGVADYFYANPNAASYQDTLVFGEGIGRWDIRPERQGDDLLVWVYDDQAITIQDWFDGTMFNKIETFAFEGGTTLLASDIDNMLGEWSEGVVASGSGTLTGSQYNDSLTATSSETRLEGGAGYDRLGATSDASGVIFVGGRGNDVIDGSLGGDTYFYDAGDGNDLVRDGGGFDDIWFRDGIAAGDIVRTRAGQDLVLDIAGSGQVQIQNWFDGTGAHRIEVIGFADGTHWSAWTAEQGLA
jgi:hypothetical protein